MDETCGVFQAPADTQPLSGKHLFTTLNPISTVDDDFLTFTFQLPIQLSEGEQGEGVL